MPVIDFRIRPPYKEFLGTAMYAGAARRDRITRDVGFEPSLGAQQQSVPLMLAEMDSAMITAGVVVGRNSGALGVVPNNVVLQFCGMYPGRFIPVASIDPACWKQGPADVDAALLAGFKAIGLEPGGAVPPLHTDDRRLYPLYAHCEARGIPLIIMTGGNAGPDISFTAPERIDRVLGDFPALRIVSSHGNWPWVQQILHIAFRRPNLYLSPDYLLANLPGMHDHLKAADSWLCERFLYASAFPFAPIKAYLDWFLTLPIRPANMDRILYRNAADLLGLTMV
jgi:predicted TIM-barrel fold metal-dependent hydrolase